MNTPTYLLEHLQWNDEWKTKGLVVGSPAFQLSANSANISSTKLGGDWALKNQIRTCLKSSTDFF